MKFKTKDELIEENPRCSMPIEQPLLILCWQRPEATFFSKGDNQCPS